MDMSSQNLIDILQSLPSTHLVADGFSDGSIINLAVYYNDNHGEVMANGITSQEAAELILLAPRMAHSIVNARQELISLLSTIQSQWSYYQSHDVVTNKANFTDYIAARIQFIVNDVLGEQKSGLEEQNG